MAIEKNIKGVIKDFTCGFCHSQAGYEIVFAEKSEIYHYYGDLLQGIAFAIVKCYQCQMLNLFVFSIDDDSNIECLITEEDELEVYLADNPEIIAPGWDGEHISPTRLKLQGQYPYRHKFSENIPQEIFQDLNEAGNCLAVGSIKASAVMCRRVVESLTEHYGIRKKSFRQELEMLKENGHIDEVAFENLLKNSTLYNDLETLRGKGRIDESLYEALSEIRKWGNIGAHKNTQINLDHFSTQQLVKLVIEATEYAFSKQRLDDLTRELSDERNNKQS